MKKLLLLVTMPIVLTGCTTTPAEVEEIITDEIVEDDVEFRTCFYNHTETEIDIEFGIFLFKGDYLWDDIVIYANDDKMSKITNTALKIFGYDSKLEALIDLNEELLRAESFEAHCEMLRNY